MGTHAFNNPISDQETRDLQQLLDAFGSLVSLGDMSSAYCQGGRNIHKAVEILLSNLHGSTSGTSLSSKGETNSQSWSSELSNEFVEKTSFAETNNITTDQKKGTASMGTVVGVIGKDYAPPKPSRYDSVEGTKPPKLNIDEYPVYETTLAGGTLHKDTEDFLFNMLGDGFQLDMKVIQDVLGFCGYDVKMSMNKLLDISASTLEKSGDAINLFAQEQPLKISSDISKESAGRLVSGPKLTKSNKERRDLEKDLLGALFTVSQRSEEAPKRNGPAKAYKKTRAFGKPVTESYFETPEEFNAPVATLLGPQEENKADEDAYQGQRKSLEEYRNTMKEYYEAAADAFTERNHELANKLMEEGHFYRQKARETDKESSQSFLGSREGGMSLDLNEYKPKEAIRLLRLHLTSLSGIQDFPYLKIIVGSETMSNKDAARKRLVEKFLEKESIKWNEESDGRTMVIRLDEVDPKGLSFAQK